jgi:hypothetical protein
VKNSDIEQTLFIFILSSNINSTNSKVVASDWQISNFTTNKEGNTLKLKIDIKYK